MPNTESRQGSLVARFWDRYLEHALSQGVKPGAARWYVRHAEQYIQAFPDKRLAAHTVDDVTAYLGEIGRKNGLQDWQFRQAVDAIQILFAIVGVDWFDQIDWGYWRDSARALPPSHPTVAREATALVAVAQQNPTEPAFLDAVHKQHPEMLTALIVEIRCRGYSIRTEKAYEGWVCRFIGFSGNRDPRSLGAPEVAFFLQDLAVRGNVAASTQNQALNALVFLFHQVLKQPLGDLGDFVRAKRPRRLPVVLTRHEVSRLLGAMTGVQHLMAAVLYGTGMRLMECIRLRVQDVDFQYRQIVVRDGKGKKDRVVPLPASLIEPLERHLREVRLLHQDDLDKGFGEVYLPDALEVSPRGQGVGVAVCFPQRPVFH